MRDRLVGRIVDDDVGGLPIALCHVDDLEVERLAIERQALGAAVEQHRLAGLQPELLAGILLRGERREHVVIIDDAVLEDLNEGGTLMGMGGLEDVWQVFVDVDRPRDEAGRAT
jgi:hypothetical protein